MTEALSVDLRGRVIVAINEGTSCRQAAARFEVSAASANRWRALMRKQGDVRCRSLGGAADLGASRLARSPPA